MPLPGKLGMSKANVFSALLASAKSFCNHLGPLARKSGFIGRKTKGFSASGFVLSLIKSVITGNASFNQLPRISVSTKRYPLLATNGLSRSHAP